jgi:CheY-like chemotaxis protein
VDAPSVLFDRIRSAEKGAPTTRPLVLVVDDSVPDRLQMRDALRHEACTDSASTVEDAVRMATATRYDALLVNVSLPDDTGLSVLKRLRFRPAYRDVPMVAMTSHTPAGDRERFLNAGFDAYVAKPFESGHLAKLVARLLRETPSIHAGRPKRKAS